MLINPINKIPQNTGSDAKKVWKRVALLNLTLYTVSTISAWFPVHAGVRIGIILPVPKS